jgi:hypothetical protein
MKNIYNDILRSEKEGWKLCAGCIPKDVYECVGCPIETRKKMGLPPQKGI